MNRFDCTQQPKWRRGYRLQFESSQQAWVILYPEGMIKLNDSAAAIAQQIDGSRDVASMIAELKQRYGDIAEIDGDVIDFMCVAQQHNWIVLH
jgi:pyrroloquinoline quinone biosynthesis protein D